MRGLKRRFVIRHTPGFSVPYSTCAAGLDHRRISVMTTLHYHPELPPDAIAFIEDSARIAAFRFWWRRSLTHRRRPAITRSF